MPGCPSPPGIPVPRGKHEVGSKLEGSTTQARHARASGLVHVAANATRRAGVTEAATPDTYMAATLRSVEVRENRFAKRVGTGRRLA